MPDGSSLARSGYATERLSQYRSCTRHCDGMKKFIETVDRPNREFNFRQGAFSKMIEDPGKKIFGAILYFGERWKIFLLHFRNIRGKDLNFKEAYTNEGNVEVWEPMTVYRQSSPMAPSVLTVLPVPNRIRLGDIAGYIKVLTKATNNP